MWIVRWIVLLLIIVVVLAFSLQNQGQTVNIQMLNWQTGDIPLYLALFVSFGAGMVAFLLIAVFQQLQTLTELSKEKRSRKKLEKEHDATAEELETVKEEMEQADKEITRLRRENEVLREEATDLRKGGKEKPEPGISSDDIEDEKNS